MLPPPPEGARLHERWLRTLTDRLWLIAAAVGAVMFIGGVGFDLVLGQHSGMPVAIVVSNGLAAVLSAILVFTLLAYGRKERHRIVERVEALNEVNHHIRNALQSLAFVAGSMRDRKEGDAISEAMARIQWALLAILPKVEPTYEPFEGSMRDVVEQERLRRQSEHQANG